MNYQRIYNQIVERARNRALNCYSEKHHIIPKCIGGTDENTNLVKLTAREHFLCHWLLVRIYPENRKLIGAFWLMCNKRNGNQQRIIPSSRAYEEAKLLISNIGVLQSVREKISATTKGRVKSEITKQRISQAKKGVRLSKEHIEAVRISKLGTKRTPGQKLIASIAQKQAWERRRRNAATT